LDDTPHIWTNFEIGIVFGWPVDYELVAKWHNKNINYFT
jgi:hypothetical protein